MFKQNLFKIWKSKGQIIEGIANSVFKKEDIEIVAEHRLSICKECPSHLYDETGDGCMVTGTGPCCDQTKGGCGCSLGFKTRSLSSSCEKGHWDAEINEDEETLLNEKLGI